MKLLESKIMSRPFNLRQRKEQNSDLINEAKNKGIKIKFNHAVIKANGYKKVKSALIGELSDDKTEYKNTNNVECDCICILTPSVHLASQSEIN